MNPWPRVSVGVARWRFACSFPARCSARFCCTPTWAKWLTAVRDGHWGWLVASVGLMAFVVVLGALRWWVFLEGAQIEMSAWNAIRPFATSIVLNLVLPTAVAGDAVRTCGRRTPERALARSGGGHGRRQADGIDLCSSWSPGWRLRSIRRPFRARSSSSWPGSRPGSIVGLRGRRSRGCRRSAGPASAA